MYIIYYRYKVYCDKPAHYIEVVPELDACCEWGQAKKVVGIEAPPG